LDVCCSEEEDPEEYPFPLTLRTKGNHGGQSPTNGSVYEGGPVGAVNGNGTTA